MIICSGEKQATGAILQARLKFSHFHEAFMNSVPLQSLSPSKSSLT